MSWLTGGGATSDRSGDDNSDDSRSAKKRAGAGLRAFGDSLNRSGVDALNDVARSEIDSMRKGGTVRGRGRKVRLHKGERAVGAKKRGKSRTKAGRR